MAYGLYLGKVMDSKTVKTPIPIAHFEAYFSHSSTSLQRSTVGTVAYH